MNPLFKKQANNQPTIQDFQKKLSQVDDSFIAKIEEEARKRGISEADIQQGKQYLNLIRNGRAY
jgi:gamma-glutamylcysteine synthetase